MGRRNNRKHKLPPFQHSGILLVDKPKEWTSHDVVNFVRGRFNIKKVGHCGTLDPAATGLLVLVLGIMTKKSQELSGSDKTYTGTILFGKETDSQDMEGEVTAEHDTSFLTDTMVEEECAKFAGPQQQIPPMVSAVKKGGKKLYELAREGKVIERDPRDIVINSIKTTRIDLPYADFEVSCSKGTYIRTLCSDIGSNLKCGGVLYSLCRTASGNFKLEDAHTIEEIKEWDQEGLLKGLADYEEFF
jgi:tRNA pseudouridine55 synthase